MGIYISRIIIEKIFSRNLTIKFPKHIAIHKLHNFVYFDKKEQLHDKTYFKKIHYTQVEEEETYLLNTTNRENDQVLAGAIVRMFIQKRFPNAKASEIEWWLISKCTHLKKRKIR
ncbi:hypothetical protein [Rickettsiales endosymbiont of Stachyamoeba lipophora]|uniref:hypothetical protein n=1 Tax=Rickettsiales endosymbiont of Stachyamoeba lipophora TaxID=2486578 RepID=UPI000F64A4E3|nr:hypothetical protein [Rickettsiales endosymbiont of Stachyamoeba lipophora]